MRNKIKRNTLIVCVFILGIIIFLSINKNIFKKTDQDFNNISVENLVEEKIFIEKYIKDNIKTIATNSPVLGGSWYVVSTTINPANKSGEVIYEDGHVQSKAKIEYIYQNNPDSIEITKFEVIK